LIAGVLDASAPRRYPRFAGCLGSGLALMERDRDEARAEQDKARCGQCQESIGDEIVTTHDAPAIFPMIARLY
jgi:hypothetical protein